MDISNGSGIGVSLFVQGCRFHCKNCFNPETWGFDGGKEWTQETKKKFLEFAAQPFVTRISILGGEPLVEENMNDVYNLITEIRDKFPNKDIWLYTGYELKTIISKPEYRKIIELCDVVVDGRYIDELRDITLKWRGSSNQNVIDVKETLKKGEIVLYDN